MTETRFRFLKKHVLQRLLSTPAAPFAPNERRSVGRLNAASCGIAAAFSPLLAHLHGSTHKDFVIVNLHSKF